MPIWPHAQYRGGFHQVATRRPGRLVDTATVRAIEELHGIPNLEDWLLRRYYLEHESYQEIADRIGVTGGTVGHWMSQMGATARAIAFRVMEDQLR